VEKAVKILSNQSLPQIQRYKKGGELPRRLVGPGSFDQPQQRTASLPDEDIIAILAEFVKGKIIYI